MTEQPRITISAQAIDEYPFSSRSNSPTILKKLSSIPFEFTENTRPGSFVSNHTPISRISSMSNMHEQISEESLTQLKQKIVKMRKDFEGASERQLKLEIPEKCTEERFWNDCEIPTLRWCAFCKCETATEIYYENTPMTFWSSVAIFFSGGVLGCCLVPYLVDTCKDSNARCHRCKHKLSHEKSKVC